MNEVIGTDNRFLFFSWSAAVGIILILGFVLSSQSMTMLGVAESREFQVSFDGPVEIKHVHVMPGQNVKRGDLLLELNQTDLELQLRTLKARFDKLSAEIKLREEISTVTKDSVHLPEGADPLKTELNDTRKEMELVERKLRNLYVFAEVDGTVGAVNVKDGERAPSFAALVTLLPLQPSFVNGYVNENLQSTIQIGQKVEVASATGKSVQGTVVSIGTRIVQIPQRLLRIQNLQAWGREVVVKIPPTNDFLLGEKVSFHKPWGIKVFSTAEANAESLLPASARVVTANLRYPTSITDQFHPEISGMVFLPELRQFALISDDYPDNKPLLLLMNDKGEVQENMLEIEGLPEMEDIESVSLNDQSLYLLSSLSATKKGHLKPGRQIFAKVDRDGIRFQLDEKLDMRLALLNAMRTSPDATLRDIAAHALGNEVDDLEIEGHAIQGDILYLALKRPHLVRNQAIILKVNSIAKLFAQKSLDPKDLSVFVRADLKVPDSDAEIKVTDMILDQDNFYLASSCKGDKCSAIWRIGLKDKRVELIQEFKVKHLESLGFHPQTHDLFGVFDSKSKGQYIVLSAGTL
ncbi:DUF3616 domain-containing protein [Bdellovibrio sp. NC01]|nr:DUF3616 domain-containing protein [Bdellovibrio sp. NC01]